jgi:hypothetical protein
MKKILLSLFLVTLALAGCDNGNKGIAFFKQTSVGMPYELLVVCGQDLWDSAAGETLKEILKSDIPGLPQPESSFRVSQTTHGTFTQIFKPFRNIIDVQIEPRLYTQTKFKYSRDKYAAPQMVLTIQSPNVREFEKFIKDGAHGKSSYSYLIAMLLKFAIIFVLSHIHDMAEKVVAT